ncbi:hypothetical protein GLV89_14630 [Halomonas alkaliantarctica]|nr:hypothetical protein [Halomonas alkaliantarctica]
MPPRRTALIESIKSGETRELLASGADAVIDVMSDSDIAGSIPFVGSVLKTYQAAQDIRDRMLIKKLAKFLEHPSQMSEKEKQKLSSEFENTEKEEGFGEQMLVLIEQSEDTEKPKIIGRLLVAHAKDHFDLTTFMRLCKMVNRAFVEDFGYLEKFNGNSHQRKNPDVEQSLHSAGFLRLKASNSTVFIEGLPANTNEGYEITQYGRWLVDLGLSEGPIPPPETPNTLFS